jgi:hypothetical protein
MQDTDRCVLDGQHIFDYAIIVRHCIQAQCGRLSILSFQVCSMRRSSGSRTVSGANSSIGHSPLANSGPRSALFVLPVLSWPLQNLCSSAFITDERYIYTSSNPLLSRNQNSKHLLLHRHTQHNVLHSDFPALRICGLRRCHERAAFCILPSVRFPSSRSDWPEHRICLLRWWRRLRVPQ